MTLHPGAGPAPLHAEANMATKRRTSATNQGKSAKKNKAGDVTGINPDLQDGGMRSGVKEAWRKKTSFSQGDVQLDCEPFPHCVIRNFIQSQSFLENLRDELLQLHFHSKSNDLYKFQQSDDLKKRNEHHISEIRSLLLLQFRSWLSEVLGVDLEPTVDIFCAKYEHTDVLLCHDDELEGRRVAFIFYLLPPWDPSDGGALDLFNTDEHYEPVSEVLTDEKCRLSLGGWFRGPSLPRPLRWTEPAAPRHTHVLGDESVLFEWVNEMYMDPLYQAQVQQEFEETSEIRLPHFLQEEKYQQVVEALRLAGVQWERRGPANKRCYARAQLQNLPSCVKECWDLLSSEAFFLLLSNMTGLKLHALAAGDDESDAEGQEGQSEGQEGQSEGQEGQSEGQEGQSDTDNREDERNDPDGQGPSSTPSSTETKQKGPPVCVGELRRWSHGDYTLLHDSVQREFALDLLLHVGCTDWKAEFGGFTSYIAHDEDEELLTVYPEENSLALVYKDKETLKFVKHINHSSAAQGREHGFTHFYDFSFTYYE